jgi:hypothetical protein
MAVAMSIERCTGRGCIGLIEMYQCPVFNTSILDYRQTHTINFSLDVMN